MTRQWSNDPPGVRLPEYVQQKLGIRSQIFYSMNNRTYINQRKEKETKELCRVVNRGICEVAWGVLLFTLSFMLCTCSSFVALPLQFLITLGIVLTEMLRTLRCGTLSKWYRCCPVEDNFQAFADDHNESLCGPKSRGFVYHVSHIRSIIPLFSIRYCMARAVGGNIVPRVYYSLWFLPFISLFAS